MAATVWNDGQSIHNEQGIIWPAMPGVNIEKVVFIRAVIMTCCLMVGQSDPSYSAISGVYTSLLDVASRHSIFILPHYMQDSSS